MSTYQNSTKYITTAGKNKSQLKSDLRRIETQHKMDMRMHNKDMQRFKAKYAKLIPNSSESSGSQGADIRMYETHNPGFCYRRDGEQRAPVGYIPNVDFNYKEMQSLMFTDGVIDLDKVLFVHLLSAHTAESLTLNATALQKDFFGRGPSLYERLVDRSKKSTGRKSLLSKLPLYVLEVKVITPIQKHNRTPKKSSSKEVRFKEGLKYEELANPTEATSQLSMKTLATVKEITKSEFFDDVYSVYSEATTSGHSSTIEFDMKSEDLRVTATERNRDLEEKMSSKLVVNEKIQQLIQLVLEALERSNEKKLQTFFSLAEDIGYIRTIANTPKITSFLKRVGKLDIIYNPDAFSLSIKNRARLTLEIEIEKPVLYYIVKDIRKGVLTRNPGPTLNIRDSKEDMASESSSSSSIDSGETDASTQSLEKRQRKGHDLDLNQVAKDLFRKAQEAQQRDMEELKRPPSANSISAITCTHNADSGGSPQPSGKTKMAKGAKYSIKKTICDACLSKWAIPLPKPTIPTVMKVPKPLVTNDTLKRIYTTSSHRLSLLIDREAEKVADDTKKLLIPKQRRDLMYSRKLLSVNKDASILSLSNDASRMPSEANSPLNSPTTSQMQAPPKPTNLVEDEAVQLARLKQEIVEKEMTARVKQFLKPSGRKVIQSRKI